MKIFLVLANNSYNSSRNTLRLKQDAYSYFSNIGYQLWSANEVPATSPLSLQFAFRPISGENTANSVEQAVTQQNVDAFMAQHDNSILTTEQQIAAVQSGALAQATAIPNWATWNTAVANQWGTDNVGTPLTNAQTSLNSMATLNLTTFKSAMQTVLNILNSMWTLQQKLAQMEIALRNQIWPNLQQ
jgi:hypothetical protein